MPRLVTRLILLASILCSALPAAGRDAWEKARAPGTHLLMRHALAPGTGDPAGFTLGDCATQRILSETGRQQARQIGERLRENDVGVDVVLTSRWCRSSETAELLEVGPVTAEPALDSFFQNRQTAADQTEALTERLAELDAGGQKVVMVTHQVNITALTDIFPASGEIVLIGLDPNGDVSVVGRIRPE